MKTEEIDKAASNYSDKEAEDNYAYISPEYRKLINVKQDAFKTELEQHIAKLEYQLGEINEHGLGDSNTALTKWTIERDLKIFKSDLNSR